MRIAAPADDEATPPFVSDDRHVLAALSGRVLERAPAGGLWGVCGPHRSGGAAHTRRGANLGAPAERLLSGRLAEVGEDLQRTRAEVKAARG